MDWDYDIDTDSLLDVILLDDDDDEQDNGGGLIGLFLRLASRFINELLEL